MNAGARQDRIDEQAAIWHVRIGGEAPDWDAFAFWLDEPDHRKAYDRVAMLDAEIGTNAAPIAAGLPANDDDSGDQVAVIIPSRRWWGLGGVAAAALAVAAVVPQLLPGRPTLVGYATGPSETQLVALKDGSSVLLDRNTRLSISDGSARHVNLALGGAYFDVRHDAARPFTVSAGEYEVRDIGTRFDVARGDGRFSVAVAQGEVAIAMGDAPATRMTAGRRMDMLAGGGGEIKLVAEASVASWRHGRLVYDNAPLALVAADVSRYAGKPITVDPSISALRFSGVLTIGDGSKLVEQIEGVLPIMVRSDGAGLHFGAARLR